MSRSPKNDLALCQTPSLLGLMGDKERGNAIKNMGQSHYGVGFSYRRHWH